MMNLLIFHTGGLPEINKIQAKLDGIEGKLKELTYLDLIEQEQEYRKGQMQ